MNKRSYSNNGNSAHKDNNNYNQRYDSNSRQYSRDFDSSNHQERSRNYNNNNNNGNAGNIVTGKRDFLQFSNGIEARGEVEEDGDRNYGEGTKQVRLDTNERRWSPESNRALSHPPMFLSPDEERLAPWMKSATMKIKNTLVRFHNEIIDFVKFITPSKEEHSRREKGVDRLRQAIIEVIPTAMIVPFGSFATGLYLPNGDIDLVLVEPKINNAILLNNLAKALMKNPDYENINVIKSAKVPLIKLVERTTQYHYDISFNKLDGVNQLKEVQKGLEYYPEMKHMLVVLKCFLRQRDLNETYMGGIGSFLLFALILTYLRELRRDYIHEDKEEEISKILLSEHLINFLEFYANFDIMGKQIIIAEGGAIVDKYVKDPSLSVISPQDATHDIGGSSFKAKDVFGIFKNRYHFLTNYNFGEQESILKYLVKAEYL